MSLTGTYKYNPETGKVEKVSDRIPNIAWMAQASVPEGGYTCYNLGDKPVEIYSRRQKYDLMQRHEVREVPRHARPGKKVEKPAELSPVSFTDPRSN